MGLSLFLQRRFWLAAVPLGVMVANAFGVEVTSDLLVTTADKVLATGTAVVSLWSLFQKNPTAPTA